MALSRYARPGFAVVIGGLLLGLAACGGHSSAVLPSAQGEQPALSQPRSKPKIAIVPASLVFKGIGAAFARHVVVSETHYKGKFTEKSACAGVARAVPASGKGPSFKPKVTPLKDGKCAITFFDAKKHSAKLEIVVAASTPRPSPTPTRAPTSAPTNAPTPTPTPIPVSTPTPTPIPSVGALPASVDICPGSGGDACTPDSAVVTVSQSGFTGSFAESDNCSASVAKVTQQSHETGAAKYQIAGQSSQGTCRATFTGLAGSTPASVSITVKASGIVVNATHI